MHNEPSRIDTAVPIISDNPALLPQWVATSINLADSRLGALALGCSDEFFAPAARMLTNGPAHFYPGRYDHNGKWMDGWESRRKRLAGHDWCLVKLGGQGKIHGFDIDTSHFIGNYPMAASVEAVLSESDDMVVLEQANWQTLLPLTPLGPDNHHLLAIDNNALWSHLRINMYPDGGIARLRVYGQAIPHVGRLFPNTPVDLAAALNGGRIVGWNDASFGSQPANILLPQRAQNMGDSWETRRRREPGYDWCLIQLGLAGKIEKIEVDTAFFRGNFPERCSMQASLSNEKDAQVLIAQSQFWPMLLPEQALTMDSIHTFNEQISDIGTISHVRFNIIPDGGIARVRLWGTPADTVHKP